MILSGREGIDLPARSAMSLAALTAGNLMGGDPALTLPAPGASLVIGVAVGLLNGLGVAVMRVPPLMTMPGTARVMVMPTQGQTSGAASPLLQGFIQRQFPLGLPGILWVRAALIPGIRLMLTWTGFGLNLSAVGSNDLATEVSGVRVRATRILAFGPSQLWSGPWSRPFSGFGGFCLPG